MGMPDYRSTHGQHMSVIEKGPAFAPTVLMVHGGPGYHWLEEDMVELDRLLREEYKTPLHIMAVQCRGCGIEPHISPNPDLTDDNLVKRAGDLKAFPSPDILLGHSTGAMITLTAMMEGFMTPKQLVLVSPYTASLGEHAFWVTQKAKEYPRAFARYETFTRAMYEKHIGPVPADFRDKLYIYWGEVFFRLSGDEQLMAMLHYLDFHVVDSMPHKGEEGGEPYAAHRLLIAHPEHISVEVRDILIRLATIDAHWWRSNFQDGYPFLDKLKAAHMTCPVRIVSGEGDRIVPPHTAKALGDILGCTVDIVPNSFHMPELKMPGDLQKHMARTLAEAAHSQR